ncbi:MAG: DUF4260 domain-containing protein [Gaiellaceae bacterium]
MALTLPGVLLRLEGLALFVAAVALYLHGDYALWPLLVFALAPDLAMLGYLAGPKAGALAYDTAHTTAAPIALGLAGVLADSGLALQIALIWAAHIGADRLLGYGLKYTTAFKDTHLQRV